MKSPILTTACLFAAAGLALFVTPAIAEDAATPADPPGRVRITDFGRNPAVRPVAGFLPVADTAPAPAPPADADAAATPPAAPAHGGGCAPGGYAAGGCAPGGCAPGGCAPVGCAPGGCAPGGSSCWSGCNDCQGEVIWEGRPCKMTGIGPIDWLKTSRMMAHGHMAAGWHKTKWCLFHRHNECETECPPAGYGVHGCPPGGMHGCPPNTCHPHKCGPHGCGPHCALLHHGLGHGPIDPGRFGYLQPYGVESHGHYSAAYPVNPWHFDERDGKVYAAEGWGKPMAVPIAPNVEHTYNYGWGIPSSRLTPLSHMPPDSRGIVPSNFPQ
ncbi:MAG: hypothetical protein WD066_09735 [Planctomycetaceae bacterium]